MQEVRHFGETTPTTLSLTNLFFPTQTAAWLHILVLDCYAKLHITWKYNDVCQQQVFIEMSPAIEIIFKFDRLFFSCLLWLLWSGFAWSRTESTADIIWDHLHLADAKHKGEQRQEDAPSLLPLLNTRTEIASLCVWLLNLCFYCTSPGSGVVTSVPSDAPDDYAALRDLQKKEVSIPVSIFQNTKSFQEKKKIRKTKQSVGFEEFLCKKWFHVPAGQQLMHSLMYISWTANVIITLFWFGRLSRHFDRSLASRMQWSCRSTR